MLEIYLVTLVGVVLAQIAPGPNLLTVAGAALGQGRCPAGFMAGGVATAVFIWVSLTALGLASLLAVYPPLLTAMKLLGGGYLCTIGLKALRAAAYGKDPAFRATAIALTPFGAWRRGLLVNLTNPKSALMWIAVTTFLFGSGLSAPEVLGFAPLGFVSALIVYGTYAFLFSTGVARRTYSRFARAAEAVFGAAFGILGGVLVADGVEELTR